MLAHDSRHDSRPDLDTMAVRLVEEFTGVWSPGAVLREVYRARERLLAHGVRAGLVDATEAAARLRLCSGPLSVLTTVVAT